MSVNVAVALKKAGHDVDAYAARVGARPSAALTW